MTHGRPPISPWQADDASATQICPRYLSPLSVNYHLSLFDQRQICNTFAFWGWGWGWERSGLGLGCFWSFNDEVDGDDVSCWRLKDLLWVERRADQSQQEYTIWWWWQNMVITDITSDKRSETRYELRSNISSGKNYSFYAWHRNKTVQFEFNPHACIG